MSWYRNPAFWLGILGATAVGGFLINRRQRQNLGAVPRGGSMLPPGLLSRKTPAASPKVREDEMFDVEPHESVPPPGEPEAIDVPDDDIPPDFDVEASPAAPSNVAVRKLCRSAKLANADPKKLCTTFCKENGWQKGTCVADECICVDKAKK